MLQADTRYARAIAWALPFLFAALATAVFLRPYILVAVHGGLPWAFDYVANIEIYSRTVIASNYFEDGFVRRGLGGTIATLLSSNWKRSTILFILFSLLCALVPLMILLRRLGVRAPLAAAYLAVVLALSPQSFFGWSRDPSRTDLLVVASVGLAVAAWAGGHRRLAVLPVLVGLCVHETAVVFGLPLLVAMAWTDLRAGALSRIELARIAGATAIGLALILLLQTLFSAPNPVVAAHMLHQAPSLAHDPVHRTWRDIAIYMAVAGPDALKTAACYNFELNPQYWLLFGVTLAMLALYAWILPLRGELLMVGLAMWVPTIFMMLIANDTGRWLKLAVANGWLIGIFLLLRGREDLLRKTDMIRGLVLLLILLPMGVTRHNNVNPGVSYVANKLGYGPPTDLQAWMDRCDPDWRRTVYGGGGHGSAVGPKP